MNDTLTDGDKQALWGLHDAVVARGNVTWEQVCALWDERGSQDFYDTYLRASVWSLEAAVLAE